MTSQYVPLLVAGLIGLLILTCSVLLLLGKGSWLIAGYNTMTDEERDKYDVKKLCRFVGIILIPVGILTPGVGLGVYLCIDWISHVYISIVLFLVVFAIVYANTGNRFMK